MSSMPSWLSDAAAINHASNNNTPPNGGPFNPSVDSPAMLDPSMGFLQNPNALDIQQFQQPPSSQPSRLQNGAPRNASPGFQHPAYQVQPVIPSKRPRPHEDGVGASPRQPSRSQTPQQVPYPGFQGNQHGPPQYAQPPNYQHLQQGESNNASPSPVMPNQQYRNPSMPQRMQTASPNPFSPAAQNFGPQGTPPQSDQNSRVNTPHTNQPPPYMNMQGMPYGTPGFNQHFTPPPNSTPNQTPHPPPGSVPPQHMPAGVNMSQQPPNAQRLYQMKLQQQYQANLMGQARAQNGGMNMAGPPPGQPPPPQMNNAMRPQQPVGRLGNPEQFLKGLAHFMHVQNQPLNANPAIGDRPIHLMQLYTTVLQMGGSKKVTQSNGWPVVAGRLQLPHPQYPTAPQELKEHFERNLALYEEAWINTQRANQQGQGRPKPMMPMQSGPQQNPQQQQQQPQQQPQPQSQQQQQPPQHHPQQQQPQQPRQQQGSPVKQAFPQPPPQSSPSAGVMQQQGHPPSTPMRQGQPQQNNVRQPTVNGFSTPQQHQARPPNMYPPQRQGSAQVMDATPPPSQQPAFPPQSPASAMKPGQNVAPMSPHAALAGYQPAPAPGPPKAAQLPENYDPAVRTLDTYGGIDVNVLSQIGAELVHHKPVAPLVVELGVIDIHALSMSLQSGIHAEVRLALDTLATLSFERGLNISLQHCDDLVEILIDCAETQVDLLVENAAEVSDSMLLSSYEDVMRGCRLEVESLQDVPEFGSPDYELDRAVERLNCITTILRNLSFFENNHELLADTNVVRFLSTVIRYLGTRNMLLRTNQNTMDFMKDVITYLSNLAQTLEIPGKEEALSLLHFLLSFAPCPPPTNPATDKVMFSPYRPSIHRYLPSAVDSLAKLLARDEPNRSYYKSIFAADVASSPPFDLLTRTFALAISPMPENVNRNLTPLVEARKPYLVQGMLAAEILANLCPGPEHNVARSWLSSEDGFAMSLLRLVCLLSTERSSAPSRHPQHPPGSRLHHEQDMQSNFPITHRGIAVLRRLAEKSQSVDDKDSRTSASSEPLPAHILPKKESLLGALLHPGIDSGMMRQLVLYAGLEN
ncbi:MAG: eukaryotic translation initiation factor 3 subunit E [Chaenotheca gracillima]|nr:MAG: eukaryotic translation initiation factor 3 subunit E [Chaenotheca gracillima]